MAQNKAKSHDKIEAGDLNEIVNAADSYPNKINSSCRSSIQNKVVQILLTTPISKVKWLAQNYYGIRHFVDEELSDKNSSMLLGSENVNDSADVVSLPESEKKELNESVDDDDNDQSFDLDQVNEQGPQSIIGNDSLVVFDLDEDYRQQHPSNIVDHQISDSLIKSYRSNILDDIDLLESNRE